MNFNHRSVLLKESIDSLHIQPDGVYMDGTAGGGGHSAAILEKLGEHGKLIAVDQDPDALQVLRERFGNNQNVIIIKNNFSNIKNILKEAGVPAIHGLLLDIGVSSYQLDTAQRGFSYHFDAPLDMRMSQAGKSARDVVNTYSEKSLPTLFFAMGRKNFPAPLPKIS